MTATLTRNKVVRCRVCGELWYASLLPEDARKVLPLPTVNPSLDRTLRKRLPGITILAYLELIAGAFTLVAVPFLLAGHIFALEGATIWGLNGVYAIVVAYGLWNLKRWTLPLLVVVNTLRVADYLLLNQPFNLGDIIPWIVLFYLAKHRDQFKESKLNDTQNIESTNTA